MEALKLFDGGKTYIVGVCWIVFAIGGLVVGEHDANTCLELVMQGLALMTVRSAIKKIEK